MFKNESEKCAENVVSKDADGVDALTKTNWSLQDIQVTPVHSNVLVKLLWFFISCVDKRRSAS